MKMVVKILDEYPEPVGKPIEWTLSGFFKPNWRLDHQDRTVASLITKNYLSFDRDASYDGNPIDLRFEKSRDMVRISRKDSQEELGIIENILNPVRVDGSHMNYMWTFTDKNGSVFTILDPDGKGSLFRSADGENLAKNVFKKTASQRSTFILLRSESDMINPWLMAVILQHHAMTVVAGA